jgi:hypothetical protein
MKLILKIEDAFDISGAGCVVTPEIPKNLGFNVRAKDPIQLRTPEGRVLDTYIDEFMSGRPRFSRYRLYCIVLPSPFSKRNIPIGTEVWLLTAD